MKGLTMSKWFEIKNQTDEKAEIWIYDVIGQDFWGEGVSAKQFVKDIKEIDGSQIDLHINSPGGSVWDGQAIFNAIKRHPANVTTFVDGLAASIASTIALAGDEVVMADNSLMMIHKAWSCVCGNADDMRGSADVLDKVDTTLVGIYARKTGQDDQTITEAMTEETWFTADEAVEFGLADRTEEGLQVAALVVDSEIYNRFKNVPESVTAKLESTTSGFVQTTSSTTNIGDFQIIYSSGADDLDIKDDEGGASEVEETPVNKEYELLKMKKGI